MVRPGRPPVIAGQLPPEKTASPTGTRYAERVGIAVGVEEALAVIMAAFGPFIIETVEIMRDDRGGEPDQDDEKCKGLGDQADGFHALAMPLSAGWQTLAAPRTVSDISIICSWRQRESRATRICHSIRSGTTPSSITSPN